MSQPSQSSVRIDWFDGTITEEPRPIIHQEEELNIPDPTIPPKKYAERKLMGFKRLHDLSNQDASTLILHLSERSSFWDLLNTDLKDDYIVLIVRIMAKLYANLLSGQKSLTLTSLLESKFMKSSFLNILPDYMFNLPHVRIAEKRMNMHFWDNAESFYNDIVILCNGICVLHSKDVQIKTKYILEALRTSVDGLMSEHMEQFSESLFKEMDQIEEKLSCISASQTNFDLHKPKFCDKSKDESNFYNLNIFPGYNEVLSKTSYKIQPNIVKGAYSSVKHYIDIQFKLLREDCFGPLREGILKYLENPRKNQFENIRVHQKVRIIRIYVSNNKVGYLVDIAWSKRLTQSTVDSSHYATNKQLMFGSLLLFTNDNFKTILCATVLDSKLSLLQEGYVAVAFTNPVTKDIFFEPYLMLESEVFFEPYHRVLKVLKEFENSDIPMQRYIVNVQSKTNAPGYLTPETIYSIPLNKSTKEISFKVLDSNLWPRSEEVGLDDSQMEAYKLALTREFAVIQGPPGTGKTYIGIQVATTLLKNLSLEGTPILLICYTNHALDQFLEGIINVTKQIIRLGSQSKSEKIQPYALHNLRIKNKSKYSYLYTNKRTELEKIFKEMMEIQSEIEKCEKEILTYKTLKPYLKIKSRIVGSYDEDPILKWLFSHLENENFEKLIVKIDDVDDWEKQIDEGNRELETIESCFSEKWALKEIDSMLYSMKYLKDVTHDENEIKKITKKFETSIEKVRKRLDYFKEYIIRNKNENTEQIIDNIEINDLYSLNVQDKWRLYFQAVNSIKEKLLHNINNLRAKYECCNQELDEIATLVDAEVVKTARVVGATTTTAARRHDLLQALRSPIVIVEEAAEVFEAHIVASLTHYCQHVILIGDHKQLRPTAAHYKLAREYNLEISLFERMINNGIHARTLITQRRMRPNFVNLIVPAIYEKLDSHPSVYNYPNVKGMKKTLYFLSHNVHEDQLSDSSWSHRNKYEAQWCVAIADYLRKMEYSKDEITILATYAGQVALIKEMSKEYCSLKGIKITVVDNYQGEENKLVILSLVRSNKEGKIGFLSAQNRICVALSRAKQGFYIVGNMDILKEFSHIWKKINSSLVSQNAIGRSLALCCRLHPVNELSIQEAEEFRNCISSGCLKICIKNDTG